MKIYTSWTIEAGENERFAPGAFDGLVGKAVPWNFRETDDGPVKRRLGTATVVGAEVSPDGRTACLTAELVWDVAEIPLPGGSPMSFSVTDHRPASDFPVIGDRAGDRPSRPVTGGSPCGDHAQDHDGKGS